MSGKRNIKLRLSEEPTSMILGTIAGDREFLDEIEDRLKDAAIPFSRSFSKLTAECLIAMARRLLDDKVALIAEIEQRPRHKR